MKTNKDQLPKTLFPFMWHFLREYKLATAIYVFLALVAGFWGPFNSCLSKSLLTCSQALRAAIFLL